MDRDALEENNWPAAGGWADGCIACFFRVGSGIFKYADLVLILF